MFKFQKNLLISQYIHKKALKSSKNHRKKKHSFLCKRCDAKFDSRKKMIEHKRAIHTYGFKDDTIYYYLFNSATQMYCCKTCDHETESKEEIEEHVKTHEETFKCETCDEVFYNAYKYSLHVKKHDEDGSDYKCPLCNYTTPRRTSISQHINMIHLKRYLYYCQFCGKGFGDVMIYKEHENIHMGASPLSCIVCQKTFSFTRNLVQHQVRFHKVGILGVQVKNQCSVCKRAYSKASTLENHMKTHEAKAPRPKTHLCDTCGKGFAQKSKLILHNRVHTGYKPYKCSYCAKSFTKKDYLVMHERVHSGEKPYCCIYCGKCFNQDASLRIHMRTHTGERPYICRFCTKGFVSNASLKIHQSKCGG